MSITSDARITTHFTSNATPESFASPKRLDPITHDPAYDPTNRCSDCNRIASLHPVVDNGFVVCSRDRFDIGSVHTRYETLTEGHLGYYDHDANGFPITYYGDESDLDRTDPWFVEYDSSMDETRIDSYRDTHPDEYTYAIDWSYINPSGVKTSGTYSEDAPQRNVSITNFEPEVRNVFVEGHDGFMSLKVYDDHLTELYALRTVLNVYTDKRTKRTRIGSIEFVTCSDGSIDARCVHGRNYPNQCNAVLNTGTTPSRTEMEEFIINVIRHGNNHAASWFKNRVESFTNTRTIDSSIPENSHTVTLSKPLVTKTFYKVHDHNCNLTCDPNVAHCTPSQESLLALQEMAQNATEQYLFNH